MYRYLSTNVGSKSKSHQKNEYSSQYRYLKNRLKYCQKVFASLILKSHRYLTRSAHTELHFIKLPSNEFCTTRAGFPDVCIVIPFNQDVWLSA